MRKHEGNAFLSKRFLPFLEKALPPLALFGAAFIYLAVVLHVSNPETGALISVAHEQLRMLLQLVAVVFGINVVGVMVNTNQFGQSANIRKLVADVSAATTHLYRLYYNAHPKDQKLQRAKWLKWLVLRVPTQSLLLKNEDKREDYYVFRPMWDGAWYQLGFSPFFDKHSHRELATIGLLHEAWLCSTRVLNLVHGLRSSGCGRLSEARGTNGSRWFLESFQQIDRRLLEGPSCYPAKVTVSEAWGTIELALQSAHYMAEEFDEHESDPNWLPFELTRYVIFHINYSIWFGFLWLKLQGLRMASVSARNSAFNGVRSEKAIGRMGLKEVTIANDELLKLEKLANSEFGLASRFWEIKGAATFGLGWAMLFFTFASIMHPFLAVSNDAEGTKLLVSAAYGMGVVALIESLYFAGLLIWPRRIYSPLSSFGSRPPRG